MLRKRSRTVQDQSKGLSDSATDQGLLVSFKGLSESDSTKSPTSPLDYRIFSNLANSFIRSPRSPGRSWDCSRVGLGLVDSLGDDNAPGHSDSKNILLGSQLRLISIANSEKIINSSKLERDDLVNHNSDVSSVELFDGFMDCLSASEDYTCIISHGPNPKTTHIFGDRVLNSCMIESQEFGKKHASINGAANSSSLPSSDFLSSCDFCGEKLEEGRDIYMYRGEKAFCSGNCREQVILIEDLSMEGMEALKS